MALDDIPEMLAAWREGKLLLDGVYSVCVRLFAGDGRAG